MKKTLILLFGTLAILGNVHTLALPSWAIDYPTKPITLLVAYGPGGAADILARALAPELERTLGQPVVVMNKAGASGSIAMGFLATVKPDGYTIAISPASLALTPYFQQVSYNVEKDFSFIAALGNYTEPFFVRSDSPFKTMEHLVDYARKNPDSIKIGVPGMATSAAIMGKFVGEKAGVRWTLIPFTSDAENITSLLGGHTHV
jgi:tripartite-type tricarboxylate transporter receptor subunit TctC